MRGGRVFFILAFVLIVGLVGVLVVWRFFLSGSNQPTAQTSPTPVPIEILLVTQNLSKGTKLDETMLTPVPWPQDNITPGMFRADQLVELKGRVVKYDLAAGLPIMDTMLLKENEQIPTSGSPWALNIPPGMVAVAVPMSRIANVAYAPRPGDHVNVIATLMFLDVDTDFQTASPNYSGLAVSAGPPDPETKEQTPATVGITSLAPAGGVDPLTGAPQPPSAAVPGIYGKVVIDPVLGQAVLVVPSELQRPRYVTHMLLQDVTVLQVGSFPLGDTALAAAPEGTPVPTAEPGGEQAAVAAPAAPDVVTLIVRPQDAVTLNYIMLAQSKMAATLSLVLRGANDTSRENVLPVTLQFLLEQYQIPVPARLPYSLNPRIEDLRLPEPVVPTPQP